jgi:hypothetical protein
VSADYSDRYDTFWSQKSIEGPAGYQKNMKSVFASIPLGLQSWFFLKGGKVNFIGNAKDYCGKLDATNLYRADGSVGGCLFIPKAEGLAGMPSIHVGVESSAYQAQMEQGSLVVQGFAALTSSFLTEIALAEKLSSNNELLYEFGVYDTGMRNFKASLAFMVIEDLINSKNLDGKSYADSMNEELKSLIASSRVLDTTVDRDARWKAFWGAYSQQGHREFINFAVAQVLDSAWCNDATRKSLFAQDTVFRKTGVYYRSKVETVLNDLFSGVEAKASASLAEESESDLVYEFVEESMSPAPTDEFGLDLAGGPVFPVLAAVLRAPFAVTSYFAENRPVSSWFANHKPIRRAVWGTTSAIVNVAQGVAVGAIKGVGTVSRGVVNVSRATVGAGARVGYRVRNGCFIRRWRC